MAEKIRLVVWDLDETFWAGTLSEGGMRYLPAHHDIVLALARRGIMSSICSKNDPDQVRDILVREGIWDSFIFPSISWEPKGQRLAALIETVQLRPATVLFIDDNHGNLSEAQFYVPELQVADQTIIPALLDDPRLVGKDDRALTRLAQYKLLETRKRDEAAAGGDNRDFLRASDIRVRIDYDIEANIDRAVELVNRTNQLNYTKKRLPEDAEAAREELRRQLDAYNVVAGLVRVSDRYGDYGYCGFYLMSRTNAGTQLTHFCFSCRILNMGVETWVYQMLERPAFHVVGEVLTPLDPAAPPVDWIRIAGAAAAADAPAAVPRIASLIARGGCDLSAVMHYFAPHVGQVVGEFNGVRDGINIRSDHSMFLRYAMTGLGTEETAVLRALGYAPEDLDTRLLEHTGPAPVWLLSFVSDAALYVFRDRRTGLTLPVTMPFLAQPGRTDLTRLDVAAIPERFQHHWIADAAAELRAHFDCLGIIAEAEFKATLAALFARAPAGTLGFILSANERRRGVPGRDGIVGPNARLNGWTRDVAAGFPAFEVVDIMAFLRDEADVDATNPNHFDRRVYFRVFEHLMARIAARRGAPAAGARADALITT